MLAVIVLLLLWLIRRLATRRRFPFVFDAVVQHVCDGDSVWVKSSDGRRLKLRIAGMDAPESEQPGGPEATETLRRLIGGKVVRVKAVAVDDYGRLVSFLQMGKSTDVGFEMVRLGAAWPYRRYYHHLTAKQQALYEAAGYDARKNRRGLWLDVAAEAPWKWRERHRSLWEKFIRWIKRVIRRLFR